MSLCEFLNLVLKEEVCRAVLLLEQKCVKFSIESLCAFEIWSFARYFPTVAVHGEVDSQRIIVEAIMQVLIGGIGIPIPECAVLFLKTL